VARKLLRNFIRMVFTCGSGTNELKLIIFTWSNCTLHNLMANEKHGTNWLDKKNFLRYIAIFTLSGFEDSYIIFLAETFYSKLITCETTKAKLQIKNSSVNFTKKFTVLTTASGQAAQLMKAAYFPAKRDSSFHLCYKQTTSLLLFTVSQIRTATASGGNSDTHWLVCNLSSMRATVCKNEGSLHNSSLSCMLFLGNCKVLPYFFQWIKDTLECPNMAKPSACFLKLVAVLAARIQLIELWNTIIASCSNRYWHAGCRFSRQNTGT